MENTVFALALVGYFIGAFIWPTWHSWRRHGTWPIVFHREAAAAQRLMGALLGLLLLGLLGAAVLVGTLGPAALGARPAAPQMRAAGWALVLLGTMITIVAQQQMGRAWRVGLDDRRTSLVTGGVFRFSRNPIFLGLLALLAGTAFIYPAWWSLGALLLTGGALRLQVGFEERHLTAMHGGDYLAYAARTGRFLPRLKSSWRPAARASATRSAEGVES